MKTSNHKPSELQGGNLFHVKQVLEQHKVPIQDFHLYLLIADLLDEIAAGKPLYMIIGATMNKSAFSVTVKGADAPLPIYGADIVDLSTQAGDLL